MVVDLRPSPGTDKCIHIGLYSVQITKSKQDSSSPALVEVGTDGTGKSKSNYRLVAVTASSKHTQWLNQMLHSRH